MAFSPAKEEVREARAVAVQRKGPDVDGLRLEAAGDSVRQRHVRGAEPFGELVQPARGVGLDEAGQLQTVPEAGADEVEVAPLGEPEEQFLPLARLGCAGCAEALIDPTDARELALQVLGPSASPHGAS